MRLLLDTDAFCKLAIGGVLHDSAQVLGTGVPECGRLPALPHMLRRGSLRKAFGAVACDALIPVADEMPAIFQAGDTWLDRLARNPAIDPGEAQVFAVAAEAGLIVVSGDKRALRALKDVEGFPEVLAGRVVVLEGLLIALGARLGVDLLRQRVRPLTQFDKVVQICFSPGSSDPVGALWSYYRSLVSELQPMVLWDPRAGGGM